MARGLGRKGGLEVRGEVGEGVVWSDWVGLVCGFHFLGVLSGRGTCAEERC